MMLKILRRRRRDPVRRLILIGANLKDRNKGRRWLKEQEDDKEERKKTLERTMKIQDCFSEERRSWESSSKDAYKKA